MKNEIIQKMCLESTKVGFLLLQTWFNQTQQYLLLL